MSAVGILSKGIKFLYATYTGSTVGTYSEIPDLMAIPSLGGEPEKVEVTCLADGVRRYINGIKDFGDLEFKFLFDNGEATSSYRVFKDLEDEAKVAIRIELPDVPASGTHGTYFDFDADVLASIDEAEVNQALTYTVKCGLQSDISCTDPA